MSESFAELFEESLNTIEMSPGSIVMGTVIDIEEDWIIVHAGLKSEGVIPKSQFLNEEGNYKCGYEIEKMSKSKYNIQTPDALVEKFGADTLRLYEMFLGPLEQFKPWNTKGINGVHNFLRKFWRLVHDSENKFFVSKDKPSANNLKTLHKTIKKIDEDIARYSFNNVVSTLMICVNELSDQKCINKEIISDFTILLSPYAPHIAEEIWNKLGTVSYTHLTLPTNREV